VVREAIASKLPIAWQTPTPSSPATRAAIERLHDSRYVQAVCSGEPRALAESQGFRWSQRFAQSVLDIWEGQTEACRLAAAGAPLVIHPVSGAHHAGVGHGSGFCTFNWLVGVVPDLPDDVDVIVLDYDAHYGDGTVACLQACAWANRVRVVDIFGTLRSRRAGAGGYDEDVRANGVFLGVDNAKGYRLALERGEQMLATWTADTRARGRRPIVVYQAGVDPYEHDRVGGIAGVTAAVLAERDSRVFASIRNLAVPVVVVLAGGYSAECVPMHVTTLRIATRTEPITASMANNGRMT
jgi:acetoin utilization deacetylase AcuC-like enzyme